MSDHDKQTNEPEILDATVVPGPADAAAPPRGAELVRATRAEGTLMPLPAEQVVEGMRAYQRLLRELLESSDWQSTDKNGNALERPFLKKCVWRKIASAFNLSFERIYNCVEREPDGTPLRAEVWIRAVAPNGQYGDGDGYCSAEEGRFKGWRGRQKLENDLRATAATRAKNRATADLVGMGEVSAEEISPAGEADDEQARILAAGARASDELVKVGLDALTKLLGDRPAAARAAERSVADHGHLPVAAGRMLCHAASEQAALGRERDQQGERRPEPHPGEADTAEAEQHGEDAPKPQDDNGSNASSVQGRQLDALMHTGGYEQETVQALCELLFEVPGAEALDELELRQLCELLKTARIGATHDSHLRRATDAAAQQLDRPEACQRLRRWLVDRAAEDANRRAA